MLVTPEYADKTGYDKNNSEDFFHNKVFFKGIGNVLFDNKV